MKLHIKKIYKATVKQLEKHKTEIEIALAIAAIAVAAFEEEEADVIAAKEDVQWHYQTLINSYKYHIDAINELLNAD